MKNLTATMKASGVDDLQDQMKLLMNTWIKNRQMGEAEAVFRLTKEYHFRESDTKCVFIPTCPRSERSKILKNVTGKPEYRNFEKIIVENQNEIEYVEQYDINSKYERRDKETFPTLKQLSSSQMVKMYEASWGKKKGKNADKVSCDDEEENNSDTENELKDMCRHIANQIITLSKTRKRNSDDTEDSNDALKRKASRQQVRNLISTSF